MKLRTLALVLGGLVGCSTLYSINDTASSMLQEKPRLEYVVQTPTAKLKSAKPKTVQPSPPPSLEAIQDAFSQAVEESWREYGAFLVDEHLQRLVQRDCFDDCDLEINDLCHPLFTVEEQIAGIYR